jgi:hypothetical protein
MNYPIPVLLAVSVAGPAIAAPKPAAKPAPRPAVKSTAKAATKPNAGKKAGSKRAERLTRAKTLLSQASAASKNAQVKQGISQALALLNRKQFAPAKAKIADLKRVAALNGDNTNAVLKLVDAEDAIGDLAGHRKGKK